MTLTDEEIIELASDLESDLVERKESLSAGTKDRVRQAICAYANDLPDYQRPGLVLVGVTDSGQPSGMRIDDQLLLTLSEIRDEGKILPLPSLEVRRIRWNTQDIAAIVVHPSAYPPVRLDGVTWIRVGPRRAKATPEEERRLSEKRRGRDLPFELQPVYESSLEDLDLLYARQRYLPSAIDAQTLADNHRSIQEQLQSVRFMSLEGHPTGVGLLVSGKDPVAFIPGAYMQFVRFEGSAMGGDPRSEFSAYGRIEDLIRRSEEVIEANNQTRVLVSGQELEIRIPDYPIEALKQIVRNAFMHRTYEGTNAPTRIYWFDDRIEIHSPGGPFGNVTVENFGQAGITDYRNRTLAEALKTLGFVQRFGLGLQKAKLEMEQNGNPPIEFLVDPSYLGVVLRRRL